MNNLLSKLNSIACCIFIILFIIVCTILSSISLIFNPGGDISFKIMKLVAKSVLWFCRVKVEIEGLENIDANKVQIFASNHSSHFDVVVLTAIIPVKTGWVAKKELFMIPFLGWLMKANRHISIDRGSGRKALMSLKEAAKKVRNGNRIVIFPEGTRSRDGELLPFKKGLFHLCIKTGVPVVPIYITGTNDVLKPDTLMIQPGNVRVLIGMELQTSNYPSNKSGILMNDLRERVLQLQKKAMEYKDVKTG